MDATTSKDPLKEKISKAILETLVISNKQSIGIAVDKIVALIQKT